MPCVAPGHCGPPSIALPYSCAHTSPLESAASYGGNGGATELENSTPLLLRTAVGSWIRQGPGGPVATVGMMKFISAGPPPTGATTFRGSAALGPPPRQNGKRAGRLSVQRAQQGGKGTDRPPQLLPPNLEGGGPTRVARLQEVAAWRGGLPLSRLKLGNLRGRQGVSAGPGTRNLLLRLPVFLLACPSTARAAMPPLAIEGEGLGEPPANGAQGMGGRGRQGMVVVTAGGMRVIGRTGKAHARAMNALWGPRMEESDTAGQARGEIPTPRAAAASATASAYQSKRTAPFVHPRQTGQARMGACRCQNGAKRDAGCSRPGTWAGANEANMSVTGIASRLRLGLPGLAGIMAWAARRTAAVAPKAEARVSIRRMIPRPWRSWQMHAIATTRRRCASSRAGEARRVARPMPYEPPGILKWATGGRWLRRVPEWATGAWTDAEVPGVRAGCLPRVITQPPGAEVAARVGASSVALFRPPPTVGSSPSPSKDPPRSTASARVPAVKPAGGACVPEALAAGVPQDESRLAGRRKKGVTMVDGWIVGGGHGGARGCATGRVGGSVLPPAPEFGARPLSPRRGWALTFTFTFAMIPAGSVSAMRTLKLSPKASQARVALPHDYADMPHRPAGLGWLPEARQSSARCQSANLNEKFAPRRQERPSCRGRQQKARHACLALSVPTCLAAP
ncbi:hypothetical protein PCL_06917 [Purpureocillium lilacinum]|uniref:Uncharacterized protein n=1 Tax=Purpureocillium lilacinum TaxID=33203 RepID=A0A2U3DTB8_PURLI|nr:hypothetical protein PCL_06917 [Purpureocillium lilacinum]